jgi:hypothetical protein
LSAEEGYGMSNVKITWNKNTIEQAKAQMLEHAFGNVRCKKCGTSPKLRAHGRYFCECGELEGAVSK